MFFLGGGLREAEAVSGPRQPPVRVRRPGTEVSRVLSQGRWKVRSGWWDADPWVVIRADFLEHCLRGVAAFYGLATTGRAADSCLPIAVTGVSRKETYSGREPAECQFDGVDRSRKRLGGTQGV